MTSRPRSPTSSPPACLHLVDKLGPVLWQLPPNLGLMEERLIEFCGLLPRTTDEAARMAEQHDERISEDRALTTTRHDQPMRHAIEVRHPTLATDRALEHPARRTTSRS